MHKAGVTEKSWRTLALVPVLLSGTLKASQFSEFAPVDLTLLAACILGITAIASLLRGGARSFGYPFRAILVFLIFSLVAALGVLRGGPGEYWLEKSQIYFLLTVPIVLCLPILIRSPWDLRVLAVCWMIAGCVASVLVLVEGGSSELYGRAGIGLATLGPAYLAAGAAVAAFAGYGERLVPLWGLLIVGFLTIPVLFAVGSRGPILGAAIGVAVYVLLGGWKRQRAIAALTITVVAAYVGVHSAPAESLGRLTLQDDVRAQLREQAWTIFASHPTVGVGWGAFPEYSPWGSDYPHNLPLEAAAELGLVGLILLAMLFIVAVIGVMRFRHHGEVRIVGSALAVALISGSASSDLTDRNFWITLVACLLLPAVFAGVPGRPGQRGQDAARDAAPAEIERPRATVTEQAIALHLHEGKGRWD